MESYITYKMVLLKTYVKLKENPNRYKNETSTQLKI